MSVGVSSPSGVEGDPGLPGGVEPVVAGAVGVRGEAEPVAGGPAVLLPPASGTFGLVPQAARPALDDGVLAATDVGVDFGPCPIGREQAEEFGVAAPGAPGRSKSRVEQLQHEADVWMLDDEWVQVGDPLFSVVAVDDRGEGFAVAQRVGSTGSQPYEVAGGGLEAAFDGVCGGLVQDQETAGDLAAQVGDDDAADMQLGDPGG